MFLKLHSTMKSKRFSVAKTWIFAAVLLTLAACAKKSSAPATTYSASPSYLPADSAARAKLLAIPGASINYEREQLLNRIDKQLSDLQGRIDDFEKQEHDLSRQRRDLERKQKALRRQAKDLKKYDASAEWQKKKESVDKLLE